MAKAQRQQAPAPAPAPKRHRPEQKISPVHSGLSVAIWLNEVEGEDGPRHYRSITISGKRYYDRKADEWKDSSSYSPADLPALIYALEKAIEFCYSKPLPGKDPADPNAAQAGTGNEVPF